MFSNARVVVPRAVMNQGSRVCKARVASVGVLVDFVAGVANVSGGDDQVNFRMLFRIVSPVAM